MRNLIRNTFNQALKRLQQNTPKILEQGSAVSLENVLIEAEISQAIFEQCYSSLKADCITIKLHEALLRFKNDDLKKASSDKKLSHRLICLEAGLNSAYIRNKITIPSSRPSQVETFLNFMNEYNLLLDTKQTENFNSNDIKSLFSQALIRLQNISTKKNGKGSAITIANVLIMAQISKATFFEKYNLFHYDIYTIKLHEALNSYIAGNLQNANSRSKLSPTLLCTEAGISTGIYRARIAQRYEAKQHTDNMVAFKNFTKMLDEFKGKAPTNSERMKVNSDIYKEREAEKKKLLRESNLKIAKIKIDFNLALGRLQNKTTHIVEIGSAITIENARIEAQIPKNIFDIAFSSFKTDCNTINLHEALERFRAGHLKNVKSDSMLTAHKICVEAGLDPAYFKVSERLKKTNPKFERLNFFLQEFDKEASNFANLREKQLKEQENNRPAQYKQAIERIINQKCIVLDNSIKQALTYTNVARELNIKNVAIVRSFINETPILKKLYSPKQENPTLIKLNQALQRIIAGKAISASKNTAITNYAVSVEAGLDQSTIRPDRKVYQNIIKDIEDAENQRLLALK